MFCPICQIEVIFQEILESLYFLCTFSQSTKNEKLNQPKMQFKKITFRLPNTFMVKFPQAEFYTFSSNGSFIHHRIDAVQQVECKCNYKSTIDGRLHNFLICFCQKTCWSCLSLFCVFCPCAQRFNGVYCDVLCSNCGSVHQRWCANQCMAKFQVLGFWEKSLLKM